MQLSSRAGLSAEFNANGSLRRKGKASGSRYLNGSS